MKASYDFRIDHHKKRLFYTLSGEVDYDALIAVSKALYKEPEYSPELDCILDLREANLLIGFNEMSRFVEWLGAKQNRLKGYVAFVTKSPATYGTTRMFAGLGDELQGEIQHFESMEDAEKWLDEMNKNRANNAS
jgi:hypothetical protein